MDTVPPHAYTDGIFKGVRGLKFYFQRHTPAGPARAILGIVRGSGPYHDVWEAIVATLVPRGYIIYGYDHREHTRLPGQGGYLTQWSQSQGDVRAFLRLIHLQNGDGPVFLLGSGLGGLIALTYALHQPESLTGVIAVNPVSVQADVQPLLARVSRSMAGLWPTTPVSAPQDAPEAEDHGFIRHEGMATAGDVAAAVEETGADSGELVIPHLIFQGSGEPGNKRNVQYGALLTELENWVREQVENLTVE